MSKQSDLVGISQGASGDPLFIDTVNDRVGINNTNPQRELHIGASDNTNHDAVIVLNNGGATGYRAGVEWRYEGNTTPRARISVNASDLILRFDTNNTERMAIDSAGRVTMPFQPHIFGSLTNTGGSGIANSFATSFSQGGLAFVTDRITVPVAGLYSISFNSICDQTTGRIDSGILINGTIIMQQLSEDNGTGYHYRSASAVLKLQANDYIQFSNDDWYNHTVTTFDTWRTASVTLIG